MTRLTAIVWIMQFLAVAFSQLNARSQETCMLRDICERRRMMEIYAAAIVSVIIGLTAIIGSELEDLKTTNKEILELLREKEEDE